MIRLQFYLGIFNGIDGLLCSVKQSSSKSVDLFNKLFLLPLIVLARTQIIVLRLARLTHVHIIEILGYLLDWWLVRWLLRHL